MIQLEHFFAPPLIALLPVFVHVAASWPALEKRAITLCRRTFRRAAPAYPITATGHTRAREFDTVTARIDRPPSCAIDQRGTHRPCLFAALELDLKPLDKLFVLQAANLHGSRVRLRICLRELTGQRVNLERDDRRQLVVGFFSHSVKAH